MRLILCSLMLVSVAAGYEQDYCYAHEEDPYLMFGTKTAYEFVHERSRNPENIPNCQPVQFWLLSRHGTRYPEKKDVSIMQHLPDLRDQIIRNHELRHKGRLCPDDLENLKKWILAVFPSQANYLANQGYDDLKFMGMRFKTQFPSLLNRTYSEDKYEFRFTDMQRTRASATAFSEGIFRSHSGIHFPPAHPNDTLLRGYKTCPRWLYEVDHNNDTYREKNLFQMGPLMQNLAQNVSSRLGFDYQLPFTEIDKMYDMCRYDKAWNIRKISPWCAVFSKEELELLDYREDLHYYYTSGYGNDINLRLGCPPVKDFIDRFSQIEDGYHQPTGVFYFTHAPMLQMVLARLGIAKDRELLSHSYHDMMKHRKWRTSQISGFAANLAVVFFMCDSGERHQVMFFLNERLVHYEGCHVGLCSWSYIKDKFSTIANECNLNLCYGDGSGSRKTHSVSWFTIAAVIVAMLYRRSAV